MEELTIDALKQKIKDRLDAEIDKFVMPAKLELPTLSEYVKEQLSTEPDSGSIQEAVNISNRIRKD